MGLYVLQCRDAARDDQIVLVVTSDSHVILQDRFGDFSVGGANWADQVSFFFLKMFQLLTRLFSLQFLTETY